MTDDLVTRLQTYVAAITAKDAGLPFDLHVGPMMCAARMEEAAAEITRLKAVIAAVKATAADLDKEGQWVAASRIRMTLTREATQTGGEEHD